MTKPWRELRERLLEAGVAPRHVRRYLRELADHFSDLKAEEMRAGRSPQEAETAALARLGTWDDLAAAMLRQRQFLSWSARAPWAVFGLGPLLTLAAAYFVACLYLWCGWRIFLPGADTPFGRSGYAVFSLPNLYFQAGKFFYVCAPVLVGWALVLLAARQRRKSRWPILAAALAAYMGASAQIHASRSALPYAWGHIQMTIFNLGSSGGATSSERMLYAGVVFALAALPYLVWRWWGTPDSPQRR